MAVSATFTTQAVNLKVGDRLWNGAAVARPIEHTIDHRLVVTFRRENGSLFVQTWSRRTPVRILR